MSGQFNDAFKQYRSRRQTKQVQDFIKGKSADFKDQSKLMKEAVAQCSDLEIMLEDMQHQLRDARAKHQMLSTLIARVISLQHHGVDEKHNYEEDPDDPQDLDENDDESGEEHAEEGDEETGSASSSVSVPQEDGTDINNADDHEKPV